MSQQDRHTLRKFFGFGSLPSESNFGDLIDSTLNTKEDGFSCSQKKGVEIKLLGAQRRWISFFGTSKAEWAIVSNEKNRNLQFVGIGDQGSKDTEILTMTPEGRLGIGRPPDDASGSFRLNVAGAIRSTGRISDSQFVLADGGWHPIAKDLDGCQAFEVMAGVGLAGQKKGRYALLHAFAVNTFNPTGFLFSFRNFKKPIRVNQAWYFSRGDRLKLRWCKEGTTGHRYRLEIRSTTAYGEGIKIQVSLTQLWFDPFMQNSTPTT